MFYTWLLQLNTWISMAARPTLPRLYLPLALDRQGGLPGAKTPSLARGYLKRSLKKVSPYTIYCMISTDHTVIHQARSTGRPKYSRYLRKTRDWWWKCVVLLIDERTQMISQNEVIQWKSKGTKCWENPQDRGWGRMKEQIFSHKNIKMLLWVLILKADFKKNESRRSNVF